MTPAISTEPPPLVMPATRAASSMAPDTRVSRPIRKQGSRAPVAGQHVGGRAADLQGELGRELLAGQAADAVGAEERHG